MDPKNYKALVKAGQLSLKKGDLLEAKLALDRVKEVGKKNSSVVRDLEVGISRVIRVIKAIRAIRCVYINNIVYFYIYI